MLILQPERLVNIREPLGTVELLGYLSGERLQFQHPVPQVRVVVVEVAKFLAFGIGTEPAAAPVGEGVDRRKQPRISAELPSVLTLLIVC